MGWEPGTSRRPVHNRQRPPRAGLRLVRLPQPVPPAVAKFGRSRIVRNQSPTTDTANEPAKWPWSVWRIEFPSPWCAPVSCSVSSDVSCSPCSGPSIAFASTPWPAIGSPRLSVIHVADLVELLERAAAQGRRLPPPAPAKLPGNGIYFACRHEHPDYLQFGRMLQQAVSRRCVAYLLCPEPLPWLVGGLGSIAGCLRGRSSSLNFDKIREATAASWACSCEAARRDLGFQPRRPLLEQLRATVEWYLEHGWL